MRPNQMLISSFTATLLFLTLCMWVWCGEESVLVACEVVVCDLEVNKMDVYRSSMIMFKSVPICGRG